MTRARIAALAVGVAIAVVATTAYAGPQEQGWSGRQARTTPEEGPLPTDGHRRVPPVVAVADDALTRLVERGGVSPSGYALARATSLFDLDRVRREFGDVSKPDPRLATLILRDLVARWPDLTSAQKDRARSILARPTDGGSDPDGNGYSVPGSSACSTNVCVHWVTSTVDVPPLQDGDADGIPDWVETADSAMEAVWNGEVSGYGYRAPKSDLTSTNHGPDGRLDVYLADIGDSGLYGYCNTDDPNAFNPSYPFWDASVFCVLDNNYFEFSPLTPLEALQTTAAHEFFHAVQGAYDWFEDAWFMESTATWMEDEMFDDINDSATYLGVSAMRRPWVPIDYGKGFFVYGNWIFWRFLSEYFGEVGSPDPTIVRRTWELADGSAGGPDYYSIQALAQANRERDWYVEWAFADFGAVNVTPKAFYGEGSRYPSPPMLKTFSLSESHPKTGSWWVKRDHLTTGYLNLKPGAGLDRASKLRVNLDLPPLATGSEATLVVLYKSGRIKYVVVKPNSQGDKTVTVPFGRGLVSRVVLTLTNASTRFDCWSNTVYSCSGEPQDDNMKYYFSATAN